MACAPEKPQNHYPADTGTLIDLDPIEAKGLDPQHVTMWFPPGFYPSCQSVVDAAMIKAGWQKGTDFESRAYEDAEHEENAWAERLPDIYRWVLAEQK